MKGVIKGLGVTLKNLTAKKVTYKYPDVPLEYA